MTINAHPCPSCGLMLEATSPQLCFPCLVREAKIKMGAVDSRIAKPKVLARKTGRPETAVVEKNLVQPEGEQRAQPIQLDEKPQKKSLHKKAKSKKSRRGRVRRVGGTSYPAPIVRSGRSSPTLHCVLCGKKLKPGTLLAHKKEKHEEIPDERPQKKLRKRSIWVSIVQGGLPGLGKRR
ncbi:hypothetical protein EXV95_06905 [Acidovorax sp. JMULE5]|uniref:hypothetical protein n=1 Tax=Acidovorax sp. JMULE5 TaxID=2518343 RepID=UPI0015A02EE1|nr:hypothetical protein [Acidovorax sp. JMULE5]QLA80390.1 hypothetical protein EXV95_06905 [Acidovorax sp. JMULE5]